MKILCVTGTRADYGIYRPLLCQLASDPYFDLKLVVTGMHLAKEFGRTLDEIGRDRLEVIATPSILFRGDSTYAMSQSVGVAILYFADIFHFHQPDCLLLLGDRGEMLAAAIAAHYQNIAIAHLHGGERSGSADDLIRHCVTRLAHIHFVSCMEAKDLLKRMGEEEWRIVPVGSLRKTDILSTLQMPREQKRALRKKYRLDARRKRLLLVMHPDSKDSVPFEKQIGEPLAALKSFADCEIIAIGSNSDAGGDLFRARIEQFVSERHHARYFASVPHDDYLFLLSEADVLVGNSSSGIIEAPFFQLPFIHVGNRQKNRARGDNVIDVPFDAEAIRKAVQTVLNEGGRGNKKPLSNPYDLVASPEREIATRLKQLPPRDILLDKSSFHFNRFNDR